MGLRQNRSKDPGIASPEKWGQSATEQEILELIRTRGVEDCAALIRFVPPEKLRTVIDLDVWKNKSSQKGRRRETFDAKQFLLWLETLLETGSDEAVEALTGMGLEFCAGAFAHYIDATPMDVYAMRRAESGLATEDKDVEHGRALELGVYAGAYVLLKTTKANKALRGVCSDDLRETMTELLSAFEEHAPEFLEGIFYHLSNLANDDVALDDFEADRHLRLEQLGYTPAHKAYEHLLRYRKDSGLSRLSLTEVKNPKGFEIEDWQSFARVWQEQTAGLVSHGEAPSLLRAFLAWAGDQDDAQKMTFNRQWVYLANLIVSGWEVGGRRFKPSSALSFLEAALSLGLRLTLREPESSPRDLASIFEASWHYLYADVCLKGTALLEKRLRTRHPLNRELREATFRFCSRHRINDISVTSWIAGGHYKRTRDLVEELQFALHPECFPLLRSLVDPSPHLIVGGRQTWIESPGDEGPALQALESLLGDLSDPFDREPQR